MAASASCQHCKTDVSDTRCAENVRHGGAEGYLFGKSKLGLLVFETDHKDPRSVLGQAKFTGFDHLEMEAVAQGFETMADGCKSTPLVVGDEVPHVLQEKRFRPLCFQDADDFKENGAPRVGKAFEFSR